MNHKQKRAQWAALERRQRAQIVGGLRDYGLTYRQIASTLEISLAKVEQCLGEANALREQGLTKVEVAAEIGIPYGSLGRVLVIKRRRGLTARQTAAMAALTDMRGMQVDVLAEFFNISVGSAHNLANALVEHRLVHPLETVQPGRAWVFPRREAAERYLGWRPKEWRPTPTGANHDRAVAQARVMLVGSDPNLWVSERILRRRAEQAVEGRSGQQALFSSGRAPRAGRPHVHDGRFLGEVDGQHGWWALEVELTRKNERAKMDLALQGAIRAARDSDDEQIIGLLYLCGSDPIAKWVDAAFKRLPPELARVDLFFAIGDFNSQWTQFIKRRAQARAATRAPRVLSPLSHLDAS